MANGRKTGGRDFAPGNNANPNGRPKMPEELRRTAKLTQAEFHKILNKFLLMNRDELKLALNDPEASSIELLIGTIIVKAAQGGDAMRAEFLLNRMIGKVKDQVSHEFVRTVTIESPDGTRTILGASVEEKNE